MSYSLSTVKSWDDTIRQLAETFRKWRIREWSVVPMRPPRARTWQSDEEKLVTLRYQPNGSPEITLTMGRQSRAQDNLRVLYLAVEAMRMNEERGIADTIREAYLQLAAPARQRDPFEVLGLRPDTPLEDIKAMYAIKAKRLHPDAGGTDEAMKELNDAWERVQAGVPHA